MILHGANASDYPCVVCGGRLPGCRWGTRYCSEECHAAATLARWRRLHPPQVIGPRQCENCGETFTPGRGRDDARYCSGRCRVAAHRARHRTSP